MATGWPGLKSFSHEFDNNFFRSVTKQNPIFFIKDYTAISGSAGKAVGSLTINSSIRLQIMPILNESLQHQKWFFLWTPYRLWHIELVGDSIAEEKMANIT